LPDLQAGPWDGFAVISMYSRQQAIDDGTLVHVTPFARDVGFRHPVALTRTVWERCVRVPGNVIGQDDAGRLWDVLGCCRVAASRCQDSHLSFQVRVQHDGAAETHTLWAICDGGDDGNPAITIMFPEDY
jgi:hypothetical protein